MYAKSFIALDGNGRLTGARTAQTIPYDHYTCYLCGSILQYHPEYGTKRPWFGHLTNLLTKNGQRHCPCVNLETKEIRQIRKLRRYVADAQPVVFRGDWHCRACNNDYHGERYCLTCSTGNFSHMLDGVTL
ncbi:hypothetical protein I5Q16_00285 [Serratia marcescens]|uniref:putative zinc ribbon protein n=1 Tax=Pluralibacter gergoviae TaxID=61647 RepID=UPI0009BB1626|nr:putative zinc ribbon protein [Pluralibacter gergoviae]MBH2713374.1 hypothetical protein [Serratia marcescens]